MSATTLRTPLGALLARAERTPEVAAFIADGQLWNCHRVASESARLAAALHGCGVQPGDRVAVHMFNRVEVVLAYLAYLACRRIGAVAVPLKTCYKTLELVAMLIRIRPAIYLGETELYGGDSDVASDVVPSGARFVVGLSGSRDGAQSGTD